VRRATRSDGLSVVIKTPAAAYRRFRELRQLEFEYHILNKLRSKGVISTLALERESGRLALVLEDFGGERLPTGNGSAFPWHRSSRSRRRPRACLGTCTH